MSLYVQGERKAGDGINIALMRSTEINTAKKNAIEKTYKPPRLKADPIIHFKYPFILIIINSIIDLIFL